MRILQRLPDSPSDLIECALLDLRETERDPRYQVSFHSKNDFWNEAWHRPSRSGDRCLVCLVGAVMVKTLGVPWGEDLSPLQFDRHTQLRLIALNELRHGEIHRALVQVLELPRNPLETERYITPYAENRWKFFRQMRLLASDLKEHGL